MRFIATLKRINRDTLKCEEVMFSRLDLETLLKDMIEYARDLGGDEHTDWRLVRAIVSEEEE